VTRPTGELHCRLSADFTDHADSLTTLLDVLAAMNGQLKAEQKKMYNQMQQKAPPMPK